MMGRQTYHRHSSLYRRSLHPGALTGGESEREIGSVISSRYVSKVGKYVVKLGYRGERSEDVWMTERQLTQLEEQFIWTPNGHSTDRVSVVGVWRGMFYAYAKLVKRTFIEPEQQDLEDLNDTED